MGARDEQAYRYLQAGQAQAKNRKAESAPGKAKPEEELCRWPHTFPLQELTKWRGSGEEPEPVASRKYSGGMGSGEAT